MKKSISMKNILLNVLLVLVFALLSFGVALVGGQSKVQAKAEEAFEMVEGASIRLNENNDDSGIRFAAKVSDTQKKYYALLVPKAMLTANDKMTGNRADIDLTGDIVAQLMTNYGVAEEDFDTKFTHFRTEEAKETTINGQTGNYVMGSIVDIPVDYHSQEYFGIFYYKQAVEDSFERKYATFTNAEYSRSVNAVATAALEAMPTMDKASKDYSLEYAKLVKKYTGIAYAGEDFEGTVYYDSKLDTDKTASGSYGKTDIYAAEAETQFTVGAAETHQYAPANATGNMLKLYANNNGTIHMGGPKLTGVTTGVEYKLEMDMKVLNASGTDMYTNANIGYCFSYDQYHDKGSATMAYVYTDATKATTFGGVGNMMQFSNTKATRVGDHVTIYFYIDSTYDKSEINFIFWNNNVSATYYIDNFKVSKVTDGAVVINETFEGGTLGLDSAQTAYSTYTNSIPFRVAASARYTLENTGVISGFNGNYLTIEQTATGDSGKIWYVNTGIKAAGTYKIEFNYIFYCGTDEAGWVDYSTPAAYDYLNRAQLYAGDTHVSSWATDVTPRTGTTHTNKYANILWLHDYRVANADYKYSLEIVVPTGYESEDIKFAFRPCSGSTKNAKCFLDNFTVTKVA